MADRSEQPHNVAALILAGLILVALAAGVSSTWISDGDGTCGAIYRPNLGRLGCSRKLMPAGVVSAVLIGGAVLAWDAARRCGHRPSRRALVAVAVGIVGVCGFFVVRGAMDHRTRTGEPGAPPPVTAPPPIRAPP